jgi:hypothetical protein
MAPRPEQAQLILQAARLGDDLLELTALIAQRDPGRRGRVTARWLQRWPCDSPVLRVCYSRDTPSFRHIEGEGVGLQAEDQREGLVDSAQLARLQATGGIAEPLRIDDRRLLDEHPRLLAAESDSWSEARRKGTRRGRGDDHRAQPEKLVRLDNDGITGATLLTTATSAWRRQMKDLAANHPLGRLGRRQFGHLLSHEPHLLTIGLISSKPTHLVAQC